jgi:hypothetical protein
MRTARAVPTPWSCRKQHDLADRALRRPILGDLLGALGADAGHPAQSPGIVLDDVEHRIAERLH